MADKTYNRQSATGDMVPIALHDNGNSTWSEQVVGITASATLPADAKQGSLVGGLWTLGSITVVEEVNIPDSAIGFRLRPSADVRFAIGEDPVVLASESLVVGNTAYANETETRILAVGTGRKLRLLGTVVNQTVGVGFF